MEVEHKWCNKLSKDNLKHKLYIAHNLWEETPLPSLYYTLWLFMGATSKWHFSKELSNESLKITTLVDLKLWTFISSSNTPIWSMQWHNLIALKKFFPMVYCTPQLEIIWPLILKGFVIKSLIFNNLTFGLSFDRNSCI